VRAAAEAGGTADPAGLLDREAPRLADFAHGALVEMELRGEGKIRPVATPWPALNAILGGGLWPGLHVFTGTTGSGKTQLALTAALAAARAKVPTLYVALELQRVELVARLAAAALTEVEGSGGRGPMWSDLYLGRPGAPLAAAKDLLPTLNALPLHVEEAPAGEWTAGLLESRVEALRARYRATPLVIVDYLQIVGPEEPRQDLRSCIRAAALRARNVARAGAIVVLLSSVSRENARLLTPGDDQVRPSWANPGKAGCDPTSLVGLGKESGEIEFSADTVLALVREEFREGGTPMHLAAAKVRAGRPGWVSLSFDGTVFSPAAVRERIT
jgi:replicative DNA helicase